MSEKKPKAQNVVKIVQSLAAQRARQRFIPLKRREINVAKMRNNFHVNRFEIRIDWDFALSGNPVKMIDLVLNAVEEFDRREYEERVRRVVEVQSTVMQWAAYLERVLSQNEYRRFVRSLLPPAPILIMPIEDLTPEPYDASPFDVFAYEAMEAERMLDKGIYFRV